MYKDAVIIKLDVNFYAINALSSLPADFVIMKLKWTLKRIKRKLTKLTDSKSSQSSAYHANMFKM
jgi:hypothetical protein